MKKSFLTKNSSETKKGAAKLAKKLAKKQGQKHALTLALSGNLGSGKTTFVQGFAKGLGIKEIPKSPTFILLQVFPFATPCVARGQHRLLKSFVHIDTYRLERPKELLHLGLKEILRDPHNIVVIEWAEKVKTLLPKDAMWIKFRHAGRNKREILILSNV